MFNDNRNAKIIAFTVVLSVVVWAGFVFFNVL